MGILFCVFSGSIGRLLRHDVQHAVLQSETDMVNEYFLNFRNLSQSFQLCTDGEAFFLEHLLPLSGNVVFGMVSGNKHEGYEGHTFGFPGFQLYQHGVKGWITFDGAHMEIDQSACFQHIVHLTVDGGTGGYRCRGPQGRSVLW